MATFFLVRHAAHDLLGKYLVGRAGGVGLSPQGREQAERLAERLARERLTSVQSSPRERALQTAEPLAVRSALPVETMAALDEIHMGEWSGKTFAELESDPRWQAWNDTRDSACCPQGESMQGVRQRIVEHLDGIVARGDSRVAIVSHADVIKAAVLHYLGLPLNAVHRLEIAPASISVLVLGAWGSKLLKLNETVA
jgi:broad specificity phosphatase PhoE